MYNSIMTIINRLKLYILKIDKKKSIVFSFPILFFLLITFIVVLADPVAIESVEINSNYSGTGSWKIDKSALWISQNKARITMDLSSQIKASDTYKDIILVIDVSGSMHGNKLSQAKSDAKDLATTILTEANNRIALVTFESTATKISDLTNDASSLNTLIDTLNPLGTTNYNGGLVEAKKIIDNYTRVANKDLIVLFLTDGFPNREIPNQVATYQIIKEMYPFVKINAIQYEMGKDIIEDIVRISDEQYIATKDTLNNILFEASLEPEYFENFVVEDYINSNFEIESIGDISSSIGTVKLSVESGMQKVYWDLGSNYRTGKRETLTIDVILKEDKRLIDDIFETNDHERITSKLEGDIEREVNSILTPSLQTKYNVIYDTNTPTGCSLANIPSEKHSPFETVNIRTQELSCSNYIFKGYELEDSSVQKINSNTFIMPGRDVIIRAIWAKLDIYQKMDGEVATALDFYKIVKNEYLSHSGYAGKYTGDHKDSFDREASKDIYYYTTETTDDETQGNNLLDKTNVLFAGFCWQMLRTTDTGGVKMIYNGIPVDGKCLNTRNDVNGLKQGQRTTNTMNGNYAYGSDFTYDLSLGTFKIAGTIKENINYTNDKSVIGMYTCKNADKDATCTTLYYIQEETTTNTSPFVYTFTITTINYASVGTTSFNTQKDSPAYVGYMYDKTYSTKLSITYNQSFKEYIGVMRNVYTSWYLYYYSDSVSWDPINNEYVLSNPTRISSGEYSQLVGKYVANSATDTYVYYITGVSGNSLYCATLSGGDLNTSILFGSSLIDNGNNTYTIDNYITIPYTDWYNNYSNYSNLYTCGNMSTVCSVPMYVISTSLTNYYYVSTDSLLISKSRNGLQLNDTLVVTKLELYQNKSNYSDYKYTCNSLDQVCTEDTLRYILSFNGESYNYAPNMYYGESVTWDGSKYTIQNVLPIEDTVSVSELSNHHYFCETIGLNECESVGFLVYFNNGRREYIILENGTKTISEALNEMFYSDNVNAKDSPAKRLVEEWHYNNLITYDNYLEETIFCNDRSISELGAWKDDGYLEQNTLYFRSPNTSTSLACSNITDQFSTSNSKAKLRFKISLPTYYEMALLNNKKPRTTAARFYLNSPDYYYINPSAHDGALASYVSESGGIGSALLNSDNGTYGVRPVISLASGVMPASGSGTMADPYVVDETIIPGT